MIKIIEMITKQSYELQKQRLRLFVKVDLEMKLQILQLQKQLFHKIKSAHIDVDNAILTLASLILAIDSVVKNTDVVHLKVLKLREKNNKVKVKREKVLSYWAIVRTLKLEQNMSFRDIAIYLKKYHKLEISYSTLYNVWNELENNTGEEK